jgi:hypothetical protein
VRWAFFGACGGPEKALGGGAEGSRSLDAETDDATAGDHISFVVGLDFVLLGCIGYASGCRVVRWVALDRGNDCEVDEGDMTGEVVL